MHTEITKNNSHQIHSYKTKKLWKKKLMATVCVCVCVFDDVATTMKFNENYEKLIYLYEF